jgi:hypothetical protein
LLLTDDTEARACGQHHATVALAGAAGDQRVDRRGKAELRRRGNVVNAAVGDQNRARDPVGRHVGERCPECGKQLGAVDLAAAGAGIDRPHFESRNAPELLDERAARCLGHLRAVAKTLACALVHHYGSDRGQGFALLAGERGVGEGQQRQRQRQRPHERAARAREQQEPDH